MNKRQLLHAFSSILCAAYVQVVVVVEFPSILEPFDIWPGFASGHANEHNFVAQYVLVIEMRGLCYAGTLEPNRELRDSWDKEVDTVSAESLIH